MNLTARQQVVAQAAVNASSYVATFDVESTVTKAEAALVLTALHTAEFEYMVADLAQLEIAAPGPMEFMSIEGAFAKAAA